MRYEISPLQTRETEKQKKKAKKKKIGNWYHCARTKPYPSFSRVTKSEKPKKKKKCTLCSVQHDILQDCNKEEKRRNCLFLLYCVYLYATAAVADRQKDLCVLQQYNSNFRVLSFFPVACCLLLCGLLFAQTTKVG